MNRKTAPNIDSAKELFLCTINNHRIYSTCSQFILENLRKKYGLNSYDKSRAVVAWEVAATRMAKLYAYQYGNGCKYFVLFNAATRRACAEMLEEYYFEQIREG